MECRSGCAACCIAPSITSPIPGMPNGKPAGQPCIQLDEELRCKLFGKPERPAFCGGLMPNEDMCGTSREQALFYLRALEESTRPSLKQQRQHNFCNDYLKAEASKGRREDFDRFLAMVPNAPPAEGDE
jgi:uncharacterized protein